MRSSGTYSRKTGCYPNLTRPIYTDTSIKYVNNRAEEHVLVKSFEPFLYLTGRMGTNILSWGGHIFEKDARIEGLCDERYFLKMLRKQNPGRKVIRINRKHMLRFDFQDLFAPDDNLLA